MVGIKAVVAVVEVGLVQVRGDDGGGRVGFSIDKGSDGKNGDVKRIEDMSAQKLAHDVHSSKTLNSQRVEKIQTSING